MTTPTDGPVLELWFDFASPYSYVAAQLAEEACARARVKLVWRPFLLGAIFTAQLGIKTSPFVLNPARLRYLWRDVARLCARRGLPFRRSSAFPRGSLLAARVALVHAGSAIEGALIRDLFAANFAHDRDIADADVVRGVLARHVADPEATLARAATDEVKAALRAQTDRAMALGLFGAPTALVDGELFFGQDRLDDALAWAHRPWLPPAADPT